MSLIVNCACGRQYNLRPDLAGRRFRCENCGSILQAGGGARTQPAPAHSPYGGPAFPEAQSSNRAALIIAVCAGVGLLLIVAVVTVVLLLNSGADDKVAAVNPQQAADEKFEDRRKQLEDDLEQQRADAERRMEELQAEQARILQEAQRQIENDRLNAGANAPGAERTVNPGESTAPMPQPGQLPAVPAGGIVTQVSLPAPERLSELRITPDARFVIAHGNSTPIFVWDREGDPAWRVYPGHKASHRICAISSDSQIVVTSDSREVHIWAISSLEPLAKFEASFCDTASFSSDLTMVATHAIGGIKVWGTQDGLLLKDVSHSGTVQAMDLKDDNQTLVTLGSMGEVTVQHANQGELGSWKLEHFGFTYGTIAAEKDLVVIRDSRNLTLFDYAAAETIFTRQVERTITDVAISGNGKYVAGISSKNVHLVDLGDRSSPRHFALPRRKIHMASVSLSADGQVLAVNPSDQESVEIWDVLEFQKRVDQMNGR